MKIIQDMKIEFNEEIQLLKKMRTEIKLEMKTLECQTKTSEVSLASMDMKEKILNLADKVEEMDSSVNKKLNLK